MPVDECKAKTSSHQFVEWQVVLQRKAEEEFTARTRQDYYLAQLAGLVRELTLTVASCSLFRLPKDAARDLNNYMLDFKTDAKENDAELTPEQIHQRMLASKSAWLGMLGMTDEVK